MNTNNGSAFVHHLLRYTNSSARRDSLLDGLERLALTSDSERLRAAAAARIASAGRVDMPHPVSGIVARLARIYHANKGSIVERGIIQRHLPEQAERRAAVALLRSIAAEPGTIRLPPVDNSEDRRLWALEHLAEMGEEGRAALRALHSSGEARSPQAREALEYMARRGFPVRDNRRSQPQP